jgi:dTDP-4-amino-4,6-dideoxygalactose transaminase
MFSILGLEEHDMITAGGGAALMAPLRRDWAALKKYAEGALPEDLLPDINAALAFVQLKEYRKNQERRREIYDMYLKSLFQSRHKTLPMENDPEQETQGAVYGFPVVISSGYKDVKQYAARKDIDTALAFAGSIADRFGDGLPGCTAAKSLALRCALFPLYPRLTGAQAGQIARVIATLP